MRAISLAEANKIIEGTFASARKRKAYALAAIVLDAGGRVKAFQKQDGASLMRFEIAYGKAFGALALNRSSRQVLSLTDHLEQAIPGRLAVEGKSQGDWVLIDAGDVIVHVFRPEVRTFYNLENMWAPGRSPRRQAN